MESCSLCERKCKVNRISGEKGYCGLGLNAYLFKDFIHWGEEGYLSPSHTIYLSGCNLRCKFCDNMTYVKKPCLEVPVNPKSLAERIEQVSKKGTKNINWVGGEPTVNLLVILKILKQVNSKIPIVWNSNMLASAEVAGVIDSFTDIYLADFKFGNDECAIKIGDFSNYFQTVTRNLKNINKKRRIIIRHLPVPGHVKCCSKTILAWLANNLPEIEVSLIANFLPSQNFQKGISREEFSELLRLQKDLGLKTVQNADLPQETPEDNGEMLLESNIIIKPDGSVLIQDLNGNLVNIAKEITQSKEF